MYLNGYTNPKDILADFIFAVCFNIEQPGDRWNLVYPEANNKVELREKIIEERRATISTSYENEKEWVNKEKQVVTPEIAQANPDRIILKLKNPLAPGGQVRIKERGKVPLYRTEREEVESFEFYVDEEKSEIHILKGVQHTDDSNMFYAVDYEKQGEESQTWYVSFEYPTFDIDDDDFQNRFFLAWKFGKELDSNSKIADNKGFQCPYITSYWHTDNLVEFPIGDWLPIEYFIQVDRKSISFVFCEDPVYLEETVHGFGYIGALDQIPGALASDNDGNFGSGGNYLTADSLENIFIGSSGRTERSKEETVDLKVYERLYEKVDGVAGAMIRERLILTINGATLEVGPHKYDDLIELDLDTLLIELQLGADYEPLSKGREDFNWYCNFIAIENQITPDPEPDDPDVPEPDDPDDPGGTVEPENFCEFYRAFDNLADSERYMEECIGGRYTYDANVSEDKRLEWTNFFNKGYADIYEEMPEIKDLLAEKEITNHLFNKPPDSNGSFTGGSFTPVRNESLITDNSAPVSVWESPEMIQGIHFEFNVYMTVEENIAMCQNNYDSKFGSSSLPQSVLVHEMGHALHCINANYLEFGEYQSWDADLYGPDEAPQLAPYKTDILNTVSTYASWFFPMEFVAEYFNIMAGKKVFGGPSRGGELVQNLQNAYDAVEGARPGGLR